MTISKANAKWNGGLKGGNGEVTAASGLFKGNYSFNSRFADGPGTTPEELIAAALSGCYSMALSAGLEKQDLKPEYVDTDAKVFLDQVEGGFGITKIEINTRAKVDGIGADEFRKVAEETKDGCPVSKALKSVDMQLMQADLV
jgi:osmotically inducible protein OsmC